MTANIVKVDLRELKKLVADGSQILMQPEAEVALVKLLELQQTINHAIEVAKHNIEESALAHNPNFTSVQAQRVKVGYQFFGAKYTIDTEHLDQLPPEMYAKEVKYKPVGKAIDQFAKEHGSLPLGILQRERNKTLTIKPIEQFEDVEL